MRQPTSSLSFLAVLVTLVVSSLRFASAQTADPVPANQDEQTTKSGDANEAPTIDAASQLEQLHNEYLRLRDQLFQSRARAATVSSALYSTRLSIRLGYTSSRYYTITRTTIRLDGANVFDDTQEKIAGDPTTRFEGYVAPGRHQVTIRIEATGKDDSRFATIMDNSFIVQTLKGKDLTITAVASDDGNLPYKWSKKESGTHKLHLDVSVQSKEHKTIVASTKDHAKKR